MSLLKKLLSNYLILSSVAVHIVGGLWLHKTYQQIKHQIQGQPLAALAQSKLSSMESKASSLELLLKPAITAIADLKVDNHIPLTPKPDILPLDIATPSGLPDECIVNTSQSLLKQLGANHCSHLLIRKGIYSIDNRKIKIAGSNRIIQGENGAVIKLKTLEGFYLDSPDIEVKGLRIEGQCGERLCEHAFHVVGNAKYTKLTNNVLVDFAAAIKVNGFNGHYPDHGIIKDTVIYNNNPAPTKSPVTPIDLVAASHWQIINNTIFDFHKSGGNRVSYGLFVKGAGEGGAISGNLIVCDAKNQTKGVQIGLSVGGGGTGKSLYRIEGAEYEYKDTLVNHNLILNCSTDVGIYLNKGQNIQLVNNLVLGSWGIDVRFRSSSAALANNIISGKINPREGGTFVESNNIIQPLSSVRGKDLSRVNLFAPEQLDFSTRPSKAAPAASINFDQTVTDFCGHRVNKSNYVGLANESFCKKRIIRIFDYNNSLINSE